MNDEELLQQQVEMSTSASLGQTVWVYRGSMWAYPWYTSVRKTLEDPAYADWYIKFKPVGPWCVSCLEQCALAAAAPRLTLAGPHPGIRTSATTTTARRFAATTITIKSRSVMS